MKAIWILLLGLLLAGCSASGDHLFPPRPDLARLDSIALTPVTFSTHQALSNERDAIQTQLAGALADRLQALGYTVVPAQGSGKAAARLDVDITYIWDERLYADEDRPLARLYPDLRLYANVTLTDLKSGAVLLHEEALGEGPIEPVWSHAPDARYTAPQRALAERISRLFPTRPR